MALDSTSPGPLARHSAASRADAVRSISRIRVCNCRLSGNSAACFSARSCCTPPPVARARMRASTLRPTASTDRSVGNGRDRQLDAELPVHGDPQLHGHQRIHAEVRQRPLRVDVLRRQPQDRSHLRLHMLGDERQRRAVVKRRHERVEVQRIGRRSRLARRADIVEQRRLEHREAGRAPDPSRWAPPSAPPRHPSPARPSPPASRSSASRALQPCRTGAPRQVGVRSWRCAPARRHRRWRPTAPPAPAGPRRAAAAPGLPDTRSPPRRRPGPGLPNSVVAEEIQQEIVEPVAARQPVEVRRAHRPWAAAPRRSAPRRDWRSVRRRAPWRRGRCP